MYQPTMELQQHDKNEWARLAADAYRTGRTGIGHRYSAAAARPSGWGMPLQRYDALQRDYRAWLIDGIDSAFPAD